jgi:uncharacterized protein YggE
MKKRWIPVLGLVAVLVILGLTGCEQGGAALGEITNLNLSNQQQGIWVTGKGEVSAVPDTASISVGISAKESTVAEAQAAASAAMDRITDALISNGVARKDIQTSYFYIYEETTWDRDRNEEVVTGYRVTNMQTIKIRDIDKVGTIIDAVARAGGDLTRISNINFSVEDPTEYYEEAREEAMADAKEKAQQLAKLAGVSLGKATYISESSDSTSAVHRVSMDIALAEAAPAPAPIETAISPGELDISLTVQVIYEVK